MRACGLGGQDLGARAEGTLKSHYYTAVKARRLHEGRTLVSWDWEFVKDLQK